MNKPEKPTFEADGRLIAAAPDLLDALQAARNSLFIAITAHSRELFDTREECEASTRQHVTIAQCDVAIAKATGK